jgi:hypothetical protein
MSFHELLEELHKLSPEELDSVQRALDEVRQTEEFVPTPEMSAAIEEARESLRKEGSIPIEDVIKEVESWSTKSP